MSGFLYIKRGDQRPVDDEAIAALGLSYAFEHDRQLANCAVNENNPSGVPSMLFADERRHKRPASYLKDEQTWRKMPAFEGRPELWLGYWNESKPTPADLARAQQVHGPSIRLADGNQWQVPIVRRLDPATQAWESRLPAYLDFDDTGHPVRGKPINGYAYLWDLTTPLVDARFAADAAEEPEVAAQSVWKAAVGLLQANYVVDLPELVMLQALSDDDLAIIIAVACRYETLLTWLDMQKKSESPAEASGLIT